MTIFFAVSSCHVLLSESDLVLLQTAAVHHVAEPCPAMQSSDSESEEERGDRMRPAASWPADLNPSIRRDGLQQTDFDSGESSETSRGCCARRREETPMGGDQTTWERHPLLLLCLFLACVCSSVQSV